MISRRHFLSTMAGSAAMVAAGSMLSPARASLPIVPVDKKADARGKAGHYRPPYQWGLGGVAIGSGFGRASSNEEAFATLNAAWAGGIRYYDTSPFYGYGLSERRFGQLLHDKKRDDFVISTKVGRVFHGSAKPHDPGLWKNPDRFDYRYDYTADGVRRSVEDSLQRLGISSIDLVFIHDLSPDNKELGAQWTDYFEIARKGAMPALTKMREEGIIKGWGLGVNTLPPILKTLEVADADVFLAAAGNYQLMQHEEGLAKLLPACADKGASLVIGSPLAAGFVAGRDRYLYDGSMPPGMKDKRARMEKIAQAHKVDLRTAALQFAAAPAEVAAVIPGARTPEQVKQNIASATARIPADFWAEMKSEKLIAAEVPVPA